MRTDSDKTRTYEPYFCELCGALIPPGQSDCPKCDDTRALQAIKETPERFEIELLLDEPTVDEEPLGAIGKLLNIMIFVLTEGSVLFVVAMLVLDARELLNSPATTATILPFMGLFCYFAGRAGFRSAKRIHKDWAAWRLRNAYREIPSDADSANPFSPW
jgi:ribosomal protein L40E